MSKKWFLPASIIGSALAVTLVIATITNYLYPIADGTYQEWSASAMGQHFVLVDEDPCNDSDYVSTTIVNDRDSYLMDLSGIPNGSIIGKIHIDPCASSYQWEGTTSTLGVFYKWNNEHSTTSTYELPPTTTPQWDVASTTWSELNLVKDASSTLEMGVIHKQGTKGSKVSSMRAKIWHFSF